MTRHYGTTQAEFQNVQAELQYIAWHLAETLAEPLLAFCKGFCSELQHLQAAVTTLLPKLTQPRS